MTMDFLLFIIDISWYFYKPLVSQKEIFTVSTEVTFGSIVQFPDVFVILQIKCLDFAL